jgi:hypothetical protein
LIKTAALLLITAFGWPWTFHDESSRANSSVRSSKPEQSFVEHNFFHDGEKWTPSWFQCDGRMDVTVFSRPQDSTSQSLVRFAKMRPQTKQTVAVERAAEPDCGMMKCWWTFRRQTKPISFFVVQQSNYYEPDDGFWSKQYRLGTGSSDETARAKLGTCRWFPRLRIAALTSQSNLYVTETRAGKLILRVFDYGRNTSLPSITLEAGTVVRDKKNGREVFSFRNAAMRYVVDIGINEPGIEIRRTKSALDRTEDVLSYTYVEKRQP